MKWKLKMKNLPSKSDIIQASNEFYLWIFTQKKNPNYKDLRNWLKIKHKDLLCRSQQIFCVCCNKLVNTKRGI